MNRIVTILGLFLFVALPCVSAPPKDVEKVALVKAGKITEARADWWGFDKVDATLCLQEAINSGVKKLIIPNMGTPWIVNPISLVSDQEIVLEPGTVVEALRNSFKGLGDSLFRASRKKNITIRGKGATLRMHKKDYQDKTRYKPAEWRHTINLGGCENVKILDLTLASSGGDGVYVGGGCRDIVIKNCMIDDHHRQGISVIGVVGLLIENCVIKNTQGTSPEAGIDFEPNRPTQRLSDITVRNCVFENNATAIAVSAGHGPGPEGMSFLFENCKAIKNRSPRPYIGGFGANPAFEKITVKMINCVHIVNGKTIVYNDFWKDVVRQAPQALTAEQLAIVERVKRVDVRGMKFKPLNEAAYTQAKKLTMPLVRGKSLVMVYAEKGETVAFAPTLMRDYGPGMSVDLLTKAGKKDRIAKISGTGTSQNLSFVAKETGTHIVQYTMSSGWVQHHSGRLNGKKTKSRGKGWALLGLDRGIHLFSSASQGTYYFYVPKGVAEFYVTAQGDGFGSERVKLSLYDPADKLVETHDNIGSMAYRFIVSRKDASRGQIWSIKVAEPTIAALEDFFVDLVGIPPILACEKASLLAPE